MLFSSKQKTGLQAKDLFLKKLDIHDINDSVVSLRDGSLNAVIEVAGTNMDELNVDDSMMMESKYRMWLESINYPVQIIGRTVNIELDKQFMMVSSTIEQSIKEKMAKKPELRPAFKEFKKFCEWFNSLINHCEEKRLYYIVIPYMPYYKSAKESRKKGNYETAKLLLEKRVNSSIKMLSVLGFKPRRLSTSQITSLLKSNFTPYIYLNEEKRYICSDEWIQLWDSWQVLRSSKVS